MSVIYKNNRLSLFQNDQHIDLLSLAHKIDQPFYLYDINGAIQRLKDFKQYVHPAEVYYSIKSNNHFSFIQSFLKEGIGVDIVSEGELNHSLKFKYSPQKIIFSGVGKTKKEIETAVRNNILQINVESLQELERIGQICKGLKLKARVACRINPNESLKTHPFIQTGTSDHKFGLEENLLPSFLEILKKYSSLSFQGLAMHMGSQGLSIDPILRGAKKLKAIYEKLNTEGYSLTTLDVGGGVGIDYESDDLNSDLKRIQKYGEGLKKIFYNFSGRLFCEPGRILTARYGWLLGEVQYIKQTAKKSFVILNTGMNHLIRPVMYQAHHRVVPLIAGSSSQQKYTIAGPICESADVLARDRLLPTLKSGDWLAFCDTGAYAAVMSSSYNMQSSALELAYLNGNFIEEKAKLF